MKKNGAVSIIVISVYVIAVLYFLGALITKSNSGAALSENSFAALVQEMETLSNSVPSDSAEYIEKSRAIADSTAHVKAVLLKKDGAPVFAYPTDSGLLREDESHLPVVYSSSPIIKIYTKNIPLASSGTVTVTAAISTMEAETIYRAALVSFLLVLASSIVLVIRLFYLRAFLPKGGKNTAVAGFEVAGTPAPRQTEQPGVEGESPAAAHIMEDAASVQSAVNYDEPVAALEQAQVSAQGDPKGLFSDATGFCREEYLEQRLDTELTQAASSEDDLALFIIKMPGLSRTSPIIRAVCDQLLMFFQYRDLIFEFGADSFAVIVTKIDLDHAMAASEQIYTNLAGILSGGNESTRLAIGISTRTIRLVPGSRLIKEAGEAVEKAMEEEKLPIVAFRVNQEKYRQYLSEENHKQLAARAEAAAQELAEAVDQNAGSEAEKVSLEESIDLVEEVLNCR